MTTEVILIPCCKRKVEDKDVEDVRDLLPTGADPWAPRDWLGTPRTLDLLPGRSAAEVRESRLALSEGLGPTLGCRVAARGPFALLPAYLRYDGVAYRTGEFRRLYARSRRQVLIVSALYGLLHPLDWIRDYDLDMGSATAKRVWKDESRLGRIVHDALARMGATLVHDLLSTHYGTALGSENQWLPADCAVKRRKYPPGFPADRERGRHLRALLSG